MKDYTNEFIKVNASEGLTPIKLANKIAQREFDAGAKWAIENIEYHIKKMSKSLQFNLETKRGKMLYKKEVLKLLKKFL